MTTTTVQLARQTRQLPRRPWFSIATGGIAAMAVASLLLPPAASAGQVAARDATGAQHATAAAPATPLLAPAWRRQLGPARREAARLHKPLLLYFCARWCGPCRALEERTFSRPSLVRLTRRWVPVKIDIDANAAIAARYGLQSPPMVLLLGPNGATVDKIEGYIDAPALIARLQRALPDARRKSAHHLSTGATP